MSSLITDFHTYQPLYGLPWWLRGKESAYNAGDTGSIPGPGRSAREGTATHASILAREIPWTEEPGGLQSMGSQESQTWLSDLSSLEIIFKLSLFLFSPLNTFLFHEIST